MKQDLKETGVEICINDVGAASLMAQEARANGIVLEGLPDGIKADMKNSVALDGTMIENHDAAGGSLTNRMRRPDRESHKWRDACRKKKHVTHVEMVNEEHDCHDHHHGHK